MGIGETAALSAAFLWTISSFLWGRIHLSAVELNICKNIVGCLLFVMHVGIMLLITQSMEPSPSTRQTDLAATSTIDAKLESTDKNSAVNLETEQESRPFRLRASLWGWTWLGLSGLIGIVIGDTLYFRSIQILGARKALLMATSSPLFAALLGWAILHENLLLLNVAGILLTVVGVMAVVGEKKSQNEAPDLFPGSQTVAIFLGLLSACCQAIGAAVSKVGMAVDDSSPLEASMVRLIVAAICSMLIIVGRRQTIAFFKRLFQWSVIGKVIPASIIGTWIGIWLSQVAIKETQVGVAQTLLSTSPLFAIPIVRFVQGHRTSAVAIAGTIVALIGIFLIVWK